MKVEPLRSSSVFLVDEEKFAWEFAEDLYMQELISVHGLEPARNKELSPEDIRGELPKATDQIEKSRCRGFTNRHREEAIFPNYTPLQESDKIHETIHILCTNGLLGKAHDAWKNNMNEGFTQMFTELVCTRAMEVGHLPRDFNVEPAYIPYVEFAFKLYKAHGLRNVYEAYFHQDLTGLQASMMNAWEERARLTAEKWEDRTNFKKSDQFKKELDDPRRRGSPRKKATAIQKEFDEKYKLLEGSDRREYNNLVKANRRSDVKRTFNDEEGLVNKLHSMLANCLTMNGNGEINATAMKKQSWVIKRCC